METIWVMVRNAEDFAIKRVVKSTRGRVVIVEKAGADDEDRLLAGFPAEDVYLLDEAAFERLNREHSPETWEQEAPLLLAFDPTSWSGPQDEDE